MIQFPIVFASLQSNTSFSDVAESYDLVAQFIQFFILTVVVIIVIRVLYIFGKWNSDRAKSAATLAKMEIDMKEAALRKIESREQDSDKLDEV